MKEKQVDFPSQDILDFYPEIEKNSKYCKNGDAYTAQLKANKIASASNTTPQYTKFTIRTTKPTAKDKFAKCYIRKDAGWSWAITGKPTDSECNVLSNCVGYAQGRFCEIYNEIKNTTGNKYKYLNCNAKNFIERAKESYPDLVIGNEPRPGAILVMGRADAAGHVIIVERVNPDGSIYTSESAYGGTAFFNKTRSYNDGHWGMSNAYYQRGFLYNPAVEVVTPVLPPITDPVEENIYKDQLVCHYAERNVRIQPSTGAQSLGYLQVDKYYNYTETKQADGYTWYKIATDQWVADAGSTEILPKQYHIGIMKNEYCKILANKTNARPGELVRVSCTAVVNYQVDKVLYNNTEIVNNQFEMPAETVNIVAVCSKIPQYKIVCNSTEGGTLTCNKTEARQNEIITYSYASSDNYSLQELKIDPTIELVEDKFVMPAADVTLSAVFIKNENENKSLIIINAIKKLIELIIGLFKK